VISIEYPARFKTTLSQKRGKTAMTMYDAFSADYDRFVNWENRLAYELPFVEDQLSRTKRPEGQPVWVLDAATGTGMHAIALATRGYQVAGADLSRGMVEKARLNAVSAGMDVRFEAVGFGKLSEVFGRESFDAVLCLGNSLPHLLTAEELEHALEDFAACLRPGGLLLLQNRNFDSVMQTHQRWMEPQSHREGRAEWVFLRFYDFLPDGLIQFNITTLFHQGGDDWKMNVTSSFLRPLLQIELAEVLPKAGFTEISYYGGMRGEPFRQAESGNLVVAACKSC
jgi:2-polyprenyl-3-methyl-5-hydroxy-6-metoxy-1,4-benzoquinol methylase